MWSDWKSQTIFFANFTEEMFFAHTYHSLTHLMLSGQMSTSREKNSFCWNSEGPQRDEKARYPLVREKWKA